MPSKIRNSHTQSTVITAFKPDEHYKYLLENLPAGAYTCDAEGLITYSNSKAIRMWGRTPALLNTSDRWCGSFKLFSTDGTPIPHDQCWMALAIKNNKKYNGVEIVIERPDGRRWTAMAHANPIINSEGKLIGAVNVLVDISKRKEDERILNESDKRKDEFLAVLAHELRNPLAPLRNAVEILRMEKNGANEDSLWALDVMERQITHMTRLVEDLMDVARINENKLILQKEIILLSDIIVSAEEASGPLLHASDIKLSVHLPMQPIYINGDLVRLSQILTNLLNNAARYSNPGGSVKLRADQVGSNVIISVEDTGIGIAPEIMPQIFDMFKQAKTAGVSRGGLGIGLTLVKRLVRLHNGTVTAFSAGTGKGSTFTVMLPIDHKEGDVRSPFQNSTRKIEGTLLNVLIVDDNKDAANTMRIMLKNLCSEVRVAYGGYEALEIAEAFNPDVVFLDIGMPILNGYDTARMMRQRPWSNNATIVAVSGWGQKNDRERSTESGFDSHFTKPAEPRVLMDILAQAALKYKK